MPNHAGALPNGNGEENPPSPSPPSTERTKWLLSAKGRLRLVIEGVPLAPPFFVPAVSPTSSIYVRNGTAAILIGVDISSPPDRNGWVCLTFSVGRMPSRNFPLPSNATLTKFTFRSSMAFDGIMGHMKNAPTTKKEPLDRPCRQLTDRTTERATGFDAQIFH